MSKQEKEAKIAIALAVKLKAGIIQAGFEHKPLTASTLIDELNKIIDVLDGWPVMGLPDCDKCEIKKKSQDDTRFFESVSQALNSGDGVYRP